MIHALRRRHRWMWAAVTMTLLTAALLASRYRPADGTVDDVTRLDWMTRPPRLEAPP